MKKLQALGKWILGAIFTVAVVAPALAPCEAHFCRTQCPMHEVKAPEPKPCCHPKAEPEAKLVAKCECVKQVLAAGEFVRPTEPLFLWELPLLEPVSLKIVEFSEVPVEVAAVPEARGPPGGFLPLAESKRGPPLS